MNLCYLQFIIISLAVLVTAVPPPSINNSQDNVKLLKFNFDNDGLGIYNYEFEQSDGTKQEQHGELRNEGTEDEYLFVKGSFTWVAPNGRIYTIRYEAGKDGYNPGKLKQYSSAGSFYSGVPPDLFAAMLGK